MMIYSGFLILKDEIKDWQIEFYWLSPFAWIIRSVCINEFNAGEYSDPPPDGSGGRRGDFYLHNFGGQRKNDRGGSEKAAFESGAA
jgi:hypothetical protein